METLEKSCLLDQQHKWKYKSGFLYFVKYTKPGINHVLKKQRQRTEYEPQLTTEEPISHQEMRVIYSVQEQPRKDL